MLNPFVFTKTDFFFVGGSLLLENRFEETIASSDGEIFRTPDHGIIIMGKIGQCDPCEFVDDITNPDGYSSSESPSGKIIVKPVFGVYEGKYLGVYSRSQYTIRKTSEDKFTVYNNTLKLSKAIRDVKFSNSDIQSFINSSFT